MFDKFEIDPDEFYSKEFFARASYELTSQNFPFVGETIAAFNSLENELNEGLIDCINFEMDDIGWIVISSMSFSVKMELWKRLSSYYINNIENEDIKKQWNDQLNKLYNNLHKVKQVRNQVAHADWDNMNEKLFVKTGTSLNQDGVKHKHLVIKKESFDEIIDSILDVEDEFMKFAIDFEKLLEQFFKGL